MPRRRRSNTGIPGLSFSWKRAFGVTKAKRRVAKWTGIPTTRSGRHRKVGKALMGGGCLIQMIGIISIAGLFVLSAILLIF